MLFVFFGSNEISPHKQEKRTCGLGQTRSKQRAFQVAITATGSPLKYIKKKTSKLTPCVLFLCLWASKRKE